MQLGRLGLALERAQARARLALDVERAVEVLLGALELQLRAAAALAVLAEAGRLLDQQAPVARLGGHDRLDAALRDDRVRLLAETGVREQLEHVDEPAVGAVEAVLALAGAVVAAQDRELAGAVGDRRVAVVEHQLDLGLRARLDAAPAGEDHVLHRLPAHGQRRLLAERPQHRVGDVGLAGAVRADDHADALAELQPRAVREGLEALDRDRLQMHRMLIPTPAAIGRDRRRRPFAGTSSARRAASCSACFLLRPEPSATGSAAPTIATTAEHPVVRRAGLLGDLVVRPSRRRARGAPAAPT